MLVFKEQFGSQVSCSHYVNSYISTAHEEHECLKQSVTHRAPARTPLQPATNSLVNAQYVWAGAGVQRSHSSSRAMPCCLYAPWPEKNGPPKHVQI